MHSLAMGLPAAHPAVPPARLCPPTAVRSSRSLIPPARLRLPPQEGRPEAKPAGPVHSYLVRPTYHLTPRSFAGVSKYPRFLATAEGELVTHRRDKRDKAASLRQIDPVMKVELRTVGAGDDDQIR